MRWDGLERSFNQKKKDLCIRDRRISVAYVPNAKSNDNINNAVRVFLLGMFTTVYRIICCCCCVNNNYDANAHKACGGGSVSPHARISVSCVAVVHLHRPSPSHRRPIASNGGGGGSCDVDSRFCIPFNRPPLSWRTPL